MQLVLYYDESTGTGCGIRYIPSDSGDERLEGFTFDATILAADSEDSVYSASHWDRWKTGYTALPVWEGGAVEDYQEACVEDESGRVTSFESPAYLRDTAQRGGCGSIPPNLPMMIMGPCGSGTWARIPSSLVPTTPAGTVILTRRAEYAMSGAT